MIRSAYIEAFVHPTESVEKVKEALSSVYSGKIKQEILEEDNIIKLFAETKKQKEIAELVKKIKKQSFSEEEHTDEEGNFYFRFDLGEAYNKKLKKTLSGYAIKVILRFSSYPKNIAMIQKEIKSTFG